MDLSFDWVIGMKLVIPFFRLEFDARQLLVKRFGEIPPRGDCGDFLVAILATKIQIAGF